MCKDTFFCKKKTLRFRGDLKELKQPWVMGILNVTPDSFYDGGRYKSLKDIVIHAQKMLSEGAVIIDVGAVSSRPGTDFVSKEEEIYRLKPVFEALSHEFPDSWFSIDTFRSEVSKMAVEEFGFYMVNDISAGKLDSKMFDEIARLNVPYVMMHMKGEPNNMQLNPTYNEIMTEVLRYFSDCLTNLNRRGVNDLIIDPGFGFGKTMEHNYKLLKELPAFEMLELPLLVGISRKSMIHKLLETTPDESINGTTVAQTIALLNGADILRVHDVKQAMEAIKMVSFYKSS